MTYPAPARAVAATLLLSVTWLALPTQAQDAPRRIGPPPPSAAQAFARGEALLEDPAAPSGDLPVTVRMAADPADPYRVHFEARVNLPGNGAAGGLDGPVRVTLLAATLEGDLASAQKTVETLSSTTTGPDGAPIQAAAWAYRDRLDVSDELHAAVVVVEDLGSGRWGAGSAGRTSLPWTEPPGVAVAVHDALAPPTDTSVGAPRSAQTPEGRVAAAPEAPPQVPAGTAGDWSLPRRPTPGSGPPPAAAGPPSAGARVIAVLPPRARPATGRTRFETLTTTGGIDRVEFFLDGELAGSDDFAPFNATLELAEEPRPHTVRVVAYDRSGRVLGEHALEVNSASATRFAVTITTLETGDAGTDLEAEVALPADATLARIEVYRNDEMVARLTEPPYRARIPPGGEPGPADFVRLVATLADGTQTEDVRFLSGDIGAERVEVNLVELFAVVTGDDGEPVEGLVPDDFEIRLGRETVPIERFQRADDVPLTLALAVDTSESMWPLMIDTRQAASRFLVNTLIPGDRALLVSFSNRPRLIAPASPDVQTLLRSFATLRAGGATALYDSIVFSLVQLEETGARGDGRRAVVLLTDGEDYGSRFRPRRVIEQAKAQGTPVYVISIGGLYGTRGGVRKPDLEAITNHTGGRTYYISDVAELPGAYAQINRELRTQYVLAFATERPLSERELGSIELRVKRRGLEARTVVEPAR